MTKIDKNNKTNSVSNGTDQIFIVLLILNKNH